MTVHGDNFKVHVWSSARGHFEMGMSMAFNGRHARAYAYTQKWGLVYFSWVDQNEIHAEEHQHYVSRNESGYEYHSNIDGVHVYTYNSAEDHWTERYRITRFDRPVAVGELLEPTWQWLQKTDFPNEPGHDGSNSRGFQIMTSDTLWNGHFGNHHGCICAIKPDWIWHGK